ncbi:hypothetical protein [Pseudogemmobacter faecipullorum]|uniref:Lipoprotein n=1 Tax=Pseudogemmobacter faecipullorum TaxID=2755041 RepID=A0ABS8CQV9_9RHOB|nr:hypothetical protein [Pseudogemmobacter faecipullorum]MCB5411766.1 hypothetical protein [Pseudogemmobacter faecipullorum]
MKALAILAALIALSACDQLTPEQINRAADLATIAADAARQAAAGVAQ